MFAGKCGVSSVFIDVIYSYVLQTFAKLLFTSEVSPPLGL